MQRVSQLNFLKPSESSKKSKKYESSDESSRRTKCFPFHASSCFKSHPFDLSPGGSKINRQIDREIAKSRRKFKTELKLLLLGAGESGKSTFIKQMQIIHGDSFDDEHLSDYKRVIYSNIIRGMKVLIDARDKLNIPWGDEGNEIYANHIQMCEDDSNLSSHQFTLFAPSVFALWSDIGITRAFDRRNEFCLSDGVCHLFQNLSRISSSNYQPTNDDILHARKATKAISEYCTTINNIPFKFVDVGGQRSQRQKWIKCFDSVTSIIFFVASSEYDQVLVEDKKTNRLLESLNVFDFIVNNRLFSEVSMILFLNKCDILEEKLHRSKESMNTEEDDNCNLVTEDISRHPITHYLPQYTGDCHDINQVKRYLMQLFCSVQRVPHKSLFTHCTTAVDTQNIRHVFNDVKKSILERNIRQMMLQ